MFTEWSLLFLNPKVNGRENLQLVFQKQLLEPAKGTSVRLQTCWPEVVLHQEICSFFSEMLKHTLVHVAQEWYVFLPYSKKVCS